MDRMPAIALKGCMVWLLKELAIISKFEILFFLLVSISTFTTIPICSCCQIICARVVRIRIPIQEPFELELHLSLPMQQDRV